MSTQRPDDRLEPLKCTLDLLALRTLILGPEHLVVWGGVRLALAGVTVGTLAALMLTRLMDRLLFAVGARNLATFCGVGALLAITSLAACYVPTRRALAVDPVTAIRHE